MSTSKTLSKTLACLAACFAIGLFAQAEDQRKIKLLLMNDDSGKIEIETEDLALGETRSFTSEKGKTVLLTRDEKGLELDVEGKKTRIELPEPGGPSGFEYEIEEALHEEGGEAQKEHRVIIKRLGPDSKLELTPGDGTRVEVIGGPGAAGEPVKKEVRVIHLGDGQGTDGKKQIQIHLHGDDDLAAARAKLIASGALDGLDAAAREKILAALGGSQN